MGRSERVLVRNNFRARDPFRKERTSILYQVHKGSGKRQNGFSWNWESLQPRACELIKVLERISSLSGSMLVDGASLVVKRLLHPEASGGTVEQAEEAEVVVFGSVWRQLDDRCRPIENLAAPIKQKMIVRRYKGEGDGEGSAKPVWEKHGVVKPPQPTFLDSLSEVPTRFQYSAKIPEMFDPKAIFDLNWFSGFFIVWK